MISNWAHRLKLRMRPPRPAGLAKLKREDALKAFRRADLTVVEDVTILEQVGTVLLSAGDLDAAEVAFDRVL